MYIEKKWNHNYLVKKIALKKLTINIWDSRQINLNHIEDISKKEFEYIVSNRKYLEFREELFNQEILDFIYFESIFLSNQINNKLFSSNLNNKFIDFPIRFIYESNKTEWSKIPFDEVEKIFNQKKYTYKVKNEIIEVENSIKVWNFMNNKFLFNIANTKKIYHILTKWLIQENWLKYPRWFKKVQVVVNNNITSSPEMVETEIKKLLSDYKINSKTENPIKLAFDFHLKFEQIHPFENWNWRTWRFLLNKILTSNWLLPMIVFEKNRQAYFNAINSAKWWNKKKYYKFMLEQYSKTIKEYWKDK